MTTRMMPWMLAGAVISLNADNAAAQARSNQPPATPPVAERPAEPERGEAHPIVRIFGDYTLGARDTARDLVVIWGSATIEGHVEGDVVVVLGAAHLTGTAVLDRDLVVVGGTATIEPGSVVSRDLVVVGGALESPTGFVPGGDQTVIGPVGTGEAVRSFVPWLTQGVLWGRLIVPSLGWIWGVVGVLLVVYLALGAVFDRPVRACVQTLIEKPLTAFLAGLLVLLLIGPISFLLTVSIVGLAVVPFLLASIFVAGILGKIGVLRWIGGSLFPEQSLEHRLHSARSLVIGFILVSLVYMVPLLGIVSWATLGTLGLGASTLAFFAGFRRENPAPTVGRASATVAPAYQQVAAAPSGSEAVAPVAGDLTLFPRATFLQRVAAFGLDLVLVLMIHGLLDLHNGGRLLILLLGYHIVFWAWKGTTVGGIICQLRLVRTDGTPVRFADALVRGLSTVFSFAVLGLGVLWVLKDPERQAWHDKIAGTYVVKVPRTWPLP